MVIVILVLFTFVGLYYVMKAMNYDDRSEERKAEEESWAKGEKPPLRNTQQPIVDLRPKCPKCGSHNLTYEIVTDSMTTKGSSEVRKKNAVTRAANTTGRATMIMATGGLWALTPKKSKYKEVKKEKTKVTRQKIALCQDCGNDWVIF